MQEQEREVIFSPTVNLTVKRDADGRVFVESFDIDWSESFQYVFEPETGATNDGRGEDRIFVDAAVQAADEVRGPVDALVRGLVEPPKEDVDA